MQKKVVLVTCVAPKKAYKCKAKDLYQGALFKQLMDFAEGIKPDKMFILSGKHHLLALDTEIKPYDLNLNNMPEMELRDWSNRVLKELREEKCDLENDYFYLLTNKIYRKYLVKEIVHFEVPFYIE